MGVSQFKQPVQPPTRPPQQPPLIQPPQQPPSIQHPRWEIGIDRNKVAAFIGVALIAGFGLGYLGARYLAGNRATIDKAKATRNNPPDSNDAINTPDTKSSGSAMSEFHKVTRIVRPDTIEAEAIGGIRMIGINTPATGPNQNGGPAQNALRFTTEALLGKEVRIELEPSLAEGAGKDEAGNKFAYVYTRDGALFNEELIRQGIAFAKVDQPSRFLDQFRAAEREAMENMRGVWSPTDKSAKGALLDSAVDKSGRRSQLPRMPDALSSSIPPNTLDARMSPGGGSDPMIFVSGSDRMYHKQGCEYLGKNNRPMMLSEAKAAGYVACGRCFASTVLKAP
jgi:endonuclease YncB( thermonuclease family)